MRAIVSSADGPVLTEISGAVAGTGGGAGAGEGQRAEQSRSGDAEGRGPWPDRRHGIATLNGLEWAGEIVEVGAAVDRWLIGDRVMAASGGAFAEYAVGHRSAHLRNPNPNGLSFEHAATLPVALQTMHDAIATNGRLEAGQSVLIQGASSGVGLMGMQVAKIAGGRACDRHLHLGRAARAA